MAFSVAPEGAPLPSFQADGAEMRFAFQNSYARLPERFYARVNPTQVRAPRLVKVNAGLARFLGIDPEALASPEGVEVLAGNRVAAGSEPLAMAYAGHQFGHFVPQLGDGRAILLGEVVGRDGARYDFQLKGSGPTPYSRAGDGRAALGPVLREYVVSEAMAALGVPTTRALAAVVTGENVYRESILPGAVLTRVAASHLRVGTFQFFAARGDVDGVRTLADYAIERHYPEVREAAKPYRGLLEGVVQRQGRLVAQWMLLGFVHGVMNTDNTSISGETIDYGPCAFVEAYDPRTVFSSIDRQGRYGYSHQPHAMHWNLARLAEALMPLLVEEENESEEAGLEAAQQALGVFAPEFDGSYMQGLRRKLGLVSERKDDVALAGDLLNLMEANEADFTLTFRRMCDAALGPEGDGGARGLFGDACAYDAWAVRWRERLQAEGVPVEERAAAMRRVNPLFIPRNHLVQEVIEAAVERGDFGPFEELVEVTSRPFEEQPGKERHAVPARPEERVLRTFCGT